MSRDENVALFSCFLFQNYEPSFFIEYTFFADGLLFRIAKDADAYMLTILSAIVSNKNLQKIFEPIMQTHGKTFAQPIIR